MSIRLKDSSSVSGGGPLVFSAVSKEELQTITDFLSMKKIKLKNEMDDLAQAEAVAALDASSDEDEAMASSDDDDDGARSRRKKKPVGVDAMDLDEDEDSEGAFFHSPCPCCFPPKRLLTIRGGHLCITRSPRARVVDEDFQADSDSDGGSASSDDSGSDDDGGAISGDEVAKEPKKKKQKTAK